MNASFCLLLFAVLSLTIISCSSHIEPVPQNVEVLKNPIKECPDSPNCFRTTQYFELDTSTVFSLIQKAVEEVNPYEIEIEANSKTRSINAVFKIPIFGWLDDVKIIVTPDMNNTSYSFVHLKSSSREGYYDLGVNKRRINRILKISRQN